MILCLTALYNILISFMQFSNKILMSFFYDQDPDNKQWFTPDKLMAPVFGTEKIKAFGMAKYLKEHLS